MIKRKRCVAFILNSIFSLIIAYAEETTKVNLSDVISQGQVYRQTTVRFDCRYKEKGDTFDILAGFSPEYYLNFSVWADDLMLREEGRTAKPYPYLYVRKESLPGGNSRLINTVLNLKKNDLIELTGIIRNRTDIPLIEAIEIELIKSYEVSDGAKRDLYLGDMYVKQNNYNKAREVYEELWEADKKNVEVSKKLAGVYLTLQKYNKVLTILKVAVKYAPEDPEIHWLLSRVYEMKGDVANAEREVTKAKDLIRTNIEIEGLPTNSE